MKYYRGKNPRRRKLLDFCLELRQPDFSFCLSLKTSEHAITSTNNGTDFILIINCRVHYYEARRRLVN